MLVTVKGIFWSLTQVILIAGNKIKDYHSLSNHSIEFLQITEDNKNIVVVFSSKELYLIDSFSFKTKIHLFLKYFDPSIVLLPYCSKNIKGLCQTIYSRQFKLKDVKNIKKNEFFDNKFDKKRKGRNNKFRIRNIL